MKKLYKVSDVSAATGVPPATLRLWEQHGLLRPKRSTGGYRLYTEEDFARVHQIVRLRSIQGLNLAAIKSVLNSAGDTVSSRAGREKATDAKPRLGPKIRKLRKEKKMTLQELGRAVDVSTSTISTLERTSRGASLPVLRSVAEVLGVTITELMATPKARVKAVVRHGEGRVLPSLGPGIEIRELASGPRMMDCQEWTITPGGGSEGFYKHEGEEFIRVLEGTFEIEVDGIGKAVMNAGDSIYFESHKPHTWRCVGKKVCRLLWVNTPPTF